MNQIKKLAGQTVIYGLSNMLGRFLNYLLIPLHTLVLGKFFFGKLTFIYSSTAILLVLLTYGLETGFFRFASKKDENYSKVLGTSLYSIVFSTSIFIFVAFLFKNLLQNYFDVNSTKIVILFILIIAFDVLNAIPFAKLRIEERPIKFMVVKLIGIFTNIFFNLFYLWFCRRLFEAGSTSFCAQIYNPEKVLEYVLIANMISSAITFIVLLPEIIKVKPVFDFALLKRIMNYSFPILLIGLAGMLNDNIDKLLIPTLINNPNPVEQLGIYGANFKLSVLMVLFIQMFRYAAEPFFFKNSENANAKKLYADVMNYFIIFGLVIFLGVMFYIDFLKYFIAPEFWEGLKVVPILLIAKLIFGILFSLSIWYKVTDKTKYGILIASIGAIITIVLNIVLLPRIGYIGSAFASLLSYSVMLAVSYYISTKHYLIKYNFKRIAFYFAFALTLFFLSKLAKIESKIIYTSMNTVFLFGFIFIAYIIEKKALTHEN
ncbi:MAG: polysaccharide biosynthesis C-terminal domain-containing protein [Bacteroidales bacterium]|nr:polysaccharide biosynthesis C-terminal domain-containing protein [Bacteroidales bacterium]